MRDRNTRLKNKFRNEVRAWVKDWRKDPYLQPAMDRFTVKFVRWNKKHSAVLYVVYDNKYETEKSCRHADWASLYADSALQFVMCDFWRAANEVLCNILDDIRRGERNE